MKKIFFVLTAVITGSQLQAQSDSSVTLLDEVVFTANKFPNKSSLTGKVVTVITRQQLEKSGGKDLSQFLAEQAGVYIGGANSNAGKDKSVYLRGARIDHTLITIDGIPVYDPSGIGGNFDLRNLSVNNIERIEILKGSQSTLYGTDAIAGVINIITKKTNAIKTGVNATASYGSNNSFRGSAGLYGNNGKTDYNAAYSYHRTGGINEAVNTGAFAVTDKDAFAQHNFHAGAGFRPSSNISIQPFFRFNKSKGDLDQGTFTDELDYTFSQQSWQAGLRNELTIGRSKLNILYSYNNVDRSFTDDSVKSTNGYSTWSHGHYEGNEHFIDAYAVIPVHTSAKATIGGDLRFTSTDQLYTAIPAWAPPVPVDEKMQQQSLYAAIDVHAAKGFNVEAGGRINFHSEYGSHAVFNFNPSWLINNKVKLFTNISSGYRTPSLYQLYSEYGNKALKPEAAMTFEGGVQYYSSKRQFSGRLVGFSRYVNDVIFFFYNPATFTSQYINQDKQKDYGLEGEASYQVSKKIQLKAFYTYLTGKIITRTGNKDTTYNNLIRRPRHSGGINLTAQITERLFVSSNLSYAGERKDAYFDNNTFQTVAVTLKSYALWDVYAEYGMAKNRCKIFADFRNVTNSRYHEIAGFNTLGFNCYAGIRFTY